MFHPLQCIIYFKDAENVDVFQHIKAKGTSWTLSDLRFLRWHCIKTSFISSWCPEASLFVEKMGHNFTSNNPSLCVFSPWSYFKQRENKCQYYWEINKSTLKLIPLIFCMFECGEWIQYALEVEKWIFIFHYNLHSCKVCITYRLIQ